MPRFSIDACRAHVTMKAPDAAAALSWGVRNLRVPAEHITVRPLPDANPPNLGHNTPITMSKKTTTTKAAKPADDIGTRVAKAARIIKANAKAKKNTLGDRVEKVTTKKLVAEAKAEGRRIADAANATGRPDQRQKAAIVDKDGTSTLSGLDAAALVLKEAKAPMGAKDIVAEIQRRGLAPKLGGATPHATIYAAMITEIAKKGSESRFTRATEKGKFQAA